MGTTKDGKSTDGNLTLTNSLKDDPTRKTESVSDDGSQATIGGTVTVDEKGEN